jgi:hypothetical protein
VVAGKRRLEVVADRRLFEEGAGILLLEGAVGSTLRVVVVLRRGLARSMLPV